MKQRMRRISALLLVALMCVSCMVPAFAAEGEGCPEIHTKTNCSYKQIGEPHEASCGEQGYTTYQCTECNTYFADDFVTSAADHAWQTVRQSPTCTADGFYKQVCLNCGDEYVVDAEEDSDYKATGHNWVAKNGEDCGEGVVCSVCGEAAKQIDDEYHVWGEPVLQTAPTHKENGTKTDGKAKVTCTVCGTSKTVTIISDGVHQWQIDQKQFASCTETGRQAGAKCLICGKTMHIAKVSDCGFVACTVRGCDHSASEENCAEVACTVENCAHFTLSAHCDEEDCEHEDCDDAGCAGAPYETIETIDCEPSDEWIVETPTCTAAGRAYKVCVMCNEIVASSVVTLNPLGHNYQDRIYVVATADDGFTAEQIALFEAFANKAEGETYTYSFLVRGENGAMTTVIGQAAIEDYVLASDLEDADLTYTAATASDSTSTETVVYYKWTGEYQNVAPYETDEAGNTYIHWGNNCSTETTSYRYACTVCGAEEEPVSWIGHYWGEPEYVAPSCDDETNGYYRYTCLNPNCDGKGEAEDVEGVVVYRDVAIAPVEAGKSAVRAQKDEIVKWGHVFETRTVLATCVAPGYSVDECKYCDAVDLTKAAEGHGKNEDDELQDGWYNIVEDATAHKAKDEWVINVTCEKNGLKHVFCEYCGATLQYSVDVAKLGHEADLERFVSDTPATCTTPGYKNYKCKNAGCNEIIAVETSAMTNHDYTKTETKTPNCLLRDPGYTITKCKNCGKVSPDDEFAAPTVFDENNPAHHVSASVLSVIVGNCTTYDIVVYKCNTCSKTWTIDDQDYVVSNDNRYNEGEGKGHQLEVVNAVKATCIADGKIKHYKCKVEGCGALFADAEGTTPITLEATIIKDLTPDGDHPAGKLVWTDKLDATCTTDGHTAGQKCTLCNEMVQRESKINKYNHTFNATYHDKTGTAWAVVTNTKDGLYGDRDATCTAWGYTWEKCALCDAEKMINYAPDFGGHDTVKVDGYVATCCSTGLTDGERCVVCGTMTLEQEVIAKLPHVNEDGEEFYGLCTDTVEDRICVACTEGKYGEDEIAINGCDGNHGDDDDIFVNAKGETVPSVEIPEKDVEALEGTGAHTWVVTYVPATCMSYSYTLVVCAHCNYDFITDTGIKYSDEHLSWGDWVVEKPATTIEEGKKVRVCACGAKEELVIPALAGLEINVDLENGVKPGAALPNNGKVNVVVNTNASDLDVWGIRIELTYEGKIDYTGIVSKGSNFANGEVAVFVNPTNKTITILATATTATSEAVENVNLNGEQELVTLQFSLKNAAMGDTVLVSAGSICEVNDKNQNKIAAEIVEEMDEDTYLYGAASIEVTATSGDIVSDGEIDIDDAKALMLFITGANKEYNSAADMNQDGEITATDYAAMRNALLGASN